MIIFVFFYCAYQLVVSSQCCVIPKIITREIKLCHNYKI